jgi:hypothetical protein
MPNAQVCMYLMVHIYYKITITNYIFKTSLYTTFRMYPSRPWPLKILETSDHIWQYKLMHYLIIRLCLA